MSRRHILIDLEEQKLDPSKAHAKVGKDGKFLSSKPVAEIEIVLKKEELKKEETIVTAPVVEEIAAVIEEVLVTEPAESVTVSEPEEKIDVVSQHETAINVPVVDETEDKSKKVLKKKKSNEHL